MNAKDYRIFKILHALASEFGHGWATGGFSDRYFRGEVFDKPRTLEALFKSVGEDMTEAEAEGGRDYGLRPSTSHETGGGRISWRVASARLVLVDVRSSKGVSVSFQAPAFGDVSVDVHHGLLEPRHIEAARWVAKALDDRQALADALPAERLEAWEEWSKTASVVDPENYANREFPEAVARLQALRTERALRGAGVRR